jgi:dihydroxyacetone kinase-like predicted kinase
VVCRALDDLRARRQEIDDLNVYPVPDGDTGTTCSDDGVGRRRDPHHDVDDSGGDEGARAGALLGARGSSGVILSAGRARLATCSVR